ncbi:hypothetical protein [Streptomyces sp. NBC_00490]|uniref:hypothetical protein n=1 Tax=Streptomyces sp. NBC_00490 TaxID=2903657 RepID=UPI002E187D05
MALLQSKIVLVNGGSQGVGAGIVQAAVREGATVVFAGRRVEELAGSIMIAALTFSFLASIGANPAAPDSMTSQATVQLQSGTPFLSDTQLETALNEANVSPQVSQAALDANAAARLDGLSAALAILAFAALLALFFTQRIPSAQLRSKER